MTVLNFISKTYLAFFYRDLRRRVGGGGGGGRWGMIKQKYPGADRVKNGKYNTVK